MKSQKTNIVDKILKTILIKSAKINKINKSKQFLKFYNKKL